MFAVVVNHLKSKGSACTAPDAGDGQGNCNAVRTTRRTRSPTWLASDPTGTGDPDVLIIGDLNAYAKEDPILTLEAAGFTNLVERYIGADAYSYVFDGQWGYLDHALGQPALSHGQVTGVDGVPHQRRRAVGARLQPDFKTAGPASARCTRRTSSGSRTTTR